RAAARAGGDDVALLASVDELGARAAASPDWVGTVEPIWRAALGTVLLEHGQPARAAAVFRELVAAHPDRINARALLGVALCENGDREQGVAVLEAVAKACDDRPGERDARWATYHFHRREFDLAIDRGKESLRRYPADPARWHAFGEAWAEKAMTATKHSLRATALEEARKAFVREIELVKRPEPSTLLALLRTLAFLRMTYEFRSGVADPDAVRVADERRELEREHEALRTSHAAGVERIDAEIVAYRQAQQRFLDERKKSGGK
ncbi:MAG: tetratricopeptide repeat protein, partial [Planctomycetes bacterium]|nr:tetratricopeptide repeat protein [Planctomycetota bacterium]